MDYNPDNYSIIDLADGEGIADGILHTMRIRTLALRCIAETVYQERLQNSMRGHGSAMDRKDLVPGSQIDIWQKPKTKMIPI